jgi:hypothetical protein
MNNRTGLILIVFLLGTVIFGFSELAFENNVFADTKLLCCHNGMCYDTPCSKTGVMADVSPLPHKYYDCHSYTFNCRTCLDYEYTGCICWINKPNVFCTNPDGSRYYGQIVPCPTQK